MTQRLPWLLPLAAVLAGPGVSQNAKAQCFSTYAPPYAAPAVVNKTVVEQVLIATPLLVPVYSTGYVPPPAAQPAAPAAPAPQPPAQNPNAELLKALESINRRLDALEKQSAPSPAPPPAATPAAPAAPKQAAGKEAPGLAILRSRCASCHTEGKLYAAAGHVTTFVLFKADGTLAPLPAAAKFKADKTAGNGTMPVAPGTLAPAPLKDEEYAELRDYLHSL